MKLMLDFMVRNESAILERCVSAARTFVDEVLVADTGSEDSTRDIARSLGAKVVEDTWRNFGWNRTLSLQAARTWAGELGWELETSYALVIDADILLRGSPEALRGELCQMPSGAHLLQKSCYLEYANQRLMRLSDPWFCEGATHDGRRGLSFALQGLDRGHWGMEAVRATNSSETSDFSWRGSAKNPIATATCSTSPRPITV